MRCLFSCKGTEFIFTVFKKKKTKALLSPIPKWSQNTIVFVILDRVLHWQIQSVAFPASNFPFLSGAVDISGNFRLGSAFGYCLVFKLTLFHNHDEWRRTCLVTALSKIIIASYFSV